ncbi:MAG TPA: PTS sugar transporter subunit IIB [Gemmatimonadaceae bacterium]|nr:PTS sugar transporter subunit IIB [Gemmatimonadaceae bacterium]
MTIELYRIDDRLIHGQVVVGWGQPMNIGFIALVDDDVAASDWEKELYRMGVPPGVDLYFASVRDAAEAMSAWRGDQRPGILLTGDIETMRRLAAAVPGIPAVNVGGIHHRSGRTEKLRYVFLTPDEESGLRALQEVGVVVTAQDVPSARPMPLRELLDGGAHKK